MSTWHQDRNVSGMRALYTKPDKGHKVVVNHPNALAYGQHFNRKRDAQRYAKRTGGFVLSAK